jgi:hypothetical protein
MNPDANYEIVSGGKQYPLHDFQDKSLQKWFSGKSVTYFRPKKFKPGKTKKLSYIDGTGVKNAIIPVDGDDDDEDYEEDGNDEEKQKEDGFLSSAVALKSAPIGSFRLIPGEFPLYPYQELAVRKWQASEPGDGMIMIVKDELFYVDSSNKRIQMVSKSAQIPTFSKVGGQCKAGSVDITKMVMKKAIKVMPSDAASYRGLDGSYAGHEKGDHLLESCLIEMHINAILIRMAERSLKTSMTTVDHTRPRFLFSGGGQNFCLDRESSENFVWTEPYINERTNLYWPASSALKTSGQARIMTASRPSVLEKAPKILGFLTVFEVPDSFYEAHGPVNLFKHDDSSLPTGCRTGALGQLCGRRGYTSVRASKFVDAVLIPKAAIMDEEVKVVMVVAIANGFHDPDRAHA